MSRATIVTCDNCGKVSSGRGEEMAWWRVTIKIMSAYGWPIIADYCSSVCMTAAMRKKFEVKA